MKKKILLLSDDLRYPSGVGTMSKEIVLGTVHKYDWIQLGGSLNSPDVGKIFDLSRDIQNQTGVKDANVMIIPCNGFGNIMLLRSILNDYKPDAILHFTDPHYWQWLYDNEHEIRQKVPLLYYHVWDNIPDPIYNRDYYESCDWIGCISKLTYGVVHRVGKMSDAPTYKPLMDSQIKYVPHGVNPDIFKPLENLSPHICDAVYGKKKYDFVLFFNSRNIRRKLPADIMYSFKLFCDKLPKEKANKCLLLMHTNSLDEHGTDLASVKYDLCPDYDIKITTNTILTQPDLNELYNLADCTINISHSEGFGLSTIESLMSGTPIIVNVTGGLQDQCGFNYSADDYITIMSLHNKMGLNEHLFTHGEWCIPIWPSAININGTITTPYIYEDRINHNDVVKGIMKMYKMSRKKRKLIGLKGREWAQKLFNNKKMCEGIIEGIDGTLNNFVSKKRFNLYKLV